MITLYAIRHKPSGEFMPQRMGRTSFGGWSWWREPNVTPFDSTPRLFPTKRGACNALSAWMQGRWTIVVEKSISFEEPYEDHYPVPEQSQTPRVRDDMEIVAFQLLEIKP